MDKEKSELALGALLHDIGKFRQRADADQDKTHDQIGYDWLRHEYGEGLIAKAARYHHGLDMETWKNHLDLMSIYEADNCMGSDPGSADPTPDAEQWHREVRLVNVFSRIRNPHSDGSQEMPDKSFHSLKRADEWAEPVSRDKEEIAEAYKELWKGFEQEFETLKTLNTHHNPEAVSHLLEKYVSCMPAISLKTSGGKGDKETYEKHLDISLYDHLKLTAAMALCLRDYHAHEKSLDEDVAGTVSWPDDAHLFMLIGGDISGVQKFIYTISSKRALKSLKGRSFFLELLTEHIVDRLLESLDLCRCNVIFTGGGHFYLLAANTSKTKQIVQDVGQEMNDYLFDAFNGAVQQFMETTSFGKNDFKNAAEIWGTLSAKLAAAKNRGWENQLDAFLSDPKMPHDTCLTKSCDVCGREDMEITLLSQDDPETRLCHPCREQLLLGEQLQSASGRGGNPIIYRFDMGHAEYEPISIRIGNAYYAIVSSGDEEKKNILPHEASGVFHLNDWDLSHFRHMTSRPLLAGTYLPEDRTSRDVGGMVRNGFGISRVAVLRMDVDFLGRMFSKGIPQPERTFSRMASLSRQMSLFFKHHINGLMGNQDGYPPASRMAAREGERRISIVYAGGDDLFLMGHWLDVTEAASDIRHAFEKFTANPHITISGGMALGGMHEPVYRLAKLAGRAEDSAKENGRNSFTPFAPHTFMWEEIDRILELAHHISHLSVITDGHLRLPADSVPKETLHKFLAIIREHRTENRQRTAKDAMEENAWMFPRFAYLFGRSRPGQKFAGSWKKLMTYIFSKYVNWHHLEVAILWNLMMMRKEDEHAE